MKLNKIEDKDADNGCLLEVERDCGSIDIFKRGNFHNSICGLIYGNVDEKTGEELEGLFDIVKRMLELENWENPCIIRKDPAKNSPFLMRLQIAFDKSHGYYESRVTVKEIDLFPISVTQANISAIEKSIEEKAQEVYTSLSDEPIEKRKEAEKAVADWAKSIKRMKHEIAVIEAIELLTEAIEENYHLIAEPPLNAQTELPL